jgi:hypothetical protein
LVHLVKGLSILFILTKNQHLTSLIFYVVLRFHLIDISSETYSFFLQLIGGFQDFKLAVGCGGCFQQCSLSCLQYNLSTIRLDPGHQVGD